MANLYNAKNGTSFVLSTANGSFTTDEMSADYDLCRVYVEFYSNAAGTVAATPTAGTVSLEVSPLGGVYVPMDNATPMPAAMVAAGGYDAPSHHGMARRGRVTFDGIVGAAYARVVFWRDEAGGEEFAPRALVQSVRRSVPDVVTLITEGRPNIKSIAIQNRDQQAIYFWHGKMYAGVLGDGAELPLNPANWTAQQLIDAKTFITGYGEKIDPGLFYEPFVAHSGRLYAVVSANTAVAHVKVGT